MRAGIDEFGDAFACRETAFFVLRFDGFGAAALRDLLFFVFDLGDEIDDFSTVLSELGRLSVDGGFQDGRRHSQSLVAKIADSADPTQKTDRPVMGAGNSVYGLRKGRASSAGKCADKIQRVGYTAPQRAGWPQFCFGGACDDPCRSSCGRVCLRTFFLGLLRQVAPPFPLSMELSC